MKPVYLPYTGAVPGADSNNYTLFDSRTTWGHLGVTNRDLVIYGLTLKNPAKCVIQAFASSTDIAPNQQYFEKVFAPCPTKQAFRVEIPIAGHPNVLIRLVNKGTAQTGLYLSQLMTGDEEGLPSIEFSNDSYISAAALTADVVGDAIVLGKKKELAVTLQVPAIDGAPNGLISLQTTLDGGTNWEDIPGAFSELPGAGVTGALTVIDKYCAWRNINADIARLKFTRASGGTGNTLSGQIWSA